MDEIRVEQTGSTATVAFTLDVADMCAFSEEETGAVSPVLTIYEDGRMVSIFIEEPPVFEGGVSEISIVAQTSAAASDMSVMLLGDGFSPLCGLLGSNL